MIRSISLGSCVLYADDATISGRNALDNGFNYETHIRRALELWMPAARGFLDVGANVGIHSLSAHAINPKCPIYAFEVSPENVNFLARSVQESGINNIHIVPVAVADTSRVVWRDGDPANTSCHQRADECFIKAIPALPLDFYRLPPIDLIKLDVEGFEYLALKGAQRLIAECKPRIIFELCPEMCSRSGVDATGLLDYVQSLGYRLTVMDYIPGTQKACANSAQVLEHLAATSRWITDVMATPI